MTTKLIDFTCIECGKKHLTEANGLEMEAGFVCNDCLYETSEIVMEGFINDPAHLGLDLDALFDEHPLEIRYPNGLSNAQAQSLETLNALAKAKALKEKQARKKSAILKELLLAAILIVSIVLYAMCKPVHAEDYNYDECTNGTWTAVGFNGAFVCVDDDGTYYPPEG